MGGKGGRGGRGGSGRTAKRADLVRDEGAERVEHDAVCHAQVVQAPLPLLQSELGERVEALVEGGGGRI